MNITFFQDTTKKHMCSLKRKYCLFELVEKQTVKYHASDLTVMFVMDNYFEISIHFRNNKKDMMITFVDILEFLNFQTETIDFVKKRQHTENTIDKYYLNILPILDEVLSIFLNDKSIFDKCLSYVNLRKVLLVQEEDFRQIKKILDVMWMNRDYASFLELFEEKKNFIQHNEILRKKADYVKKLQEKNRGTVSGDCTRDDSVC